MNGIIEQNSEQRGYVERHDHHPLKVKDPAAKPEPQQQSTSNDNIATSTSYASMLAEAYDGDGSEALAAVHAGRRVEDPDEKRERIDEPDVETKNKAPLAAPYSVQADEASDGSVKQVRRNDNVDSVVRAGSAAAKKPASSVRSSHDQLMIASSQMEASETATHIAFRAFLDLVGILSQPTWLRQDGPEKTLIRAQLRPAGGRSEA